MEQSLLKKLRMLLPLAAVTLLMPLPTAAQTRIAVVSDIHVMAPSLLTPGTAWTADYAKERKMLDKSAALFDAFVGEMTSPSKQVDILLITGDLTKDGELASHNYVRGDKNDTGLGYDIGLKVLKDAGIKVFVIPGNHDIPTGTVYKYNGDTKTALTADEKMANATAFESFYSDYGYGTGSTVDPNGSLSYVAEPVTGLVILAIDSHTGSIPAASLTWLCNQATTAISAGKQVIAMMHHPLVPHITGADMFVDTYTVANYETVRNELIAAGVKVILTGHFHTSDIAYDWNSSETDGIYDINTGSLISYPCDYRILSLSLSQDKQQVSVSTSSLNEISDLEPADVPSGGGWKEWLEGRVRTIATAQIAAKEAFVVSLLGSSLSDEEKTFLVNTTVSAFSLHAEGDENSNAASETLLSQFDSSTGSGSDAYITVKTGLQPSFHSMLEDKSDYGGTHVNQTDDRNVDILSIPANGWATYCTSQNIDITRTNGPDGLKAYYVSDVNATEATLTEISKIPSGEGFLLKGTAGTYALMAPTSAASAITNKLVGTLVATPAVTGNYALATHSGTTAFYPVKAGVSIPAHKAYIASVPAASRMVSLGGDGGTTDIQFIEKGLDNHAEQPIYTLQGTRANSLRPGIYIQNGKKVVIK